MKRGFCLFLLSLMVIGLFVTPADYEITPDLIDHFGENTPNDTLYYPDLGFPTVNYFPSSEGDLSSDSITSFSETTDDDVLFYPDLFTLDVTETPDNGYTDGGESGTWANTQVKDSTTWDISSDCAYLEVLARADVEGFAYALYAKENLAGDAVEFEVYDWIDTAYDTLTTIAGTTLGWHNGTANNANYVNSSNYLKFRFDISVTEAVYIDYLEMDEWHILTMMDSDHYAESFKDISDWAFDSESTGLPSRSFTSDEDVLTFEIGFDDTGNEYAKYDTPITVSLGSMLEINFLCSVTTGSYMSARLNLVLDSTTVYSGHTSTWLTKRVWLPDFFTSAPTELTLYIDDYSNTNDHDTGYVKFDYIRIGDPTEMGWQHDCSTTEGSYNDGSANWEYTDSSDEDILSLNITRTSANPSSNSWSLYQLCFDKTSTKASLERDYYPFVGIRWRVTTLTAESIYPVYWFDGYKADGTIIQSTFGWTTTYFNIRAMTSAYSPTYDGVRFCVKGDSENEQAIIDVEWVKAFGIANWTVTQSGVSTDDYLYVDSGVLHAVVDSGTISIADTPEISVDDTYDAWNLTSGTLPPEFRMYVGGWGSWYDEARGPTPSGTITDTNVKFDTNSWLSAIKYWEDAVAPTIEEKWSTPQDPDTSDDVTISIVTTDVMGVYEATATPLSEPEGSSVGTQTFTLTDTNPSGAMFWSVTIDNTDLIEGHYVFELEADDAANSDYEYLTFTVGADTQTTYIRIFDSLGDFVPFETFEVYRNGSRQYTDTFEGDTESAYQIQVKDRWGESLNTTTFAAGDQELVVTVEVYSLKIMSWHYDFVRFNVTRAGLTYSEIVTPLEVINFRLYTNTYDWAIDYLNGTSTSGDITLTNSTALIVTGSTISDVLGLVTTVNTMTTAINITTTTISSEVVTIQLMFDWSNTTLYNQSINIIAAFNWENTTLYNQTISIASLFNATNTVLYDQIILIQNMFNWENTTLYNQTISILNAFNATNTIIYTQTVSILADISNVNSTIYAQTVQMLLDLENSNSTLYTQTVTLLANIANIDSDIVAQTVTILADIENVNSTIYAQTVQVLSNISNMNSTIYAQTVTILSQIVNVNSTLYTQTVSILSQLVNVNSTIYSQTLSILSNLSELNATIFLVDDPSHLNPLIIGHSYSDVYCDFTIVTNWHNATLSIYDNDVLRTGPTSELLCPIRYPLLSTSGTHNLSVFVDGGNDSFWYNISYTVAEIVAFELEDWHVTPQLGVENYLECFFRTTWGNSTIYVYLNDSLQTSILEQEGGISFGFWMTGISGLHNYVFNVTSGAEVITITWDYYLPDWADTGLVVRWDMWTFQNNYTLINLESNWMNCTFYIYLNDSLVATSYNDPVTLNFTRTINEGTYNLTIHAYGGNQNYTIKNIRYIVTAEGVTYDFSSVTGGVTYVYGDTYEGDTHGDTYENPTGWYMDQATAAIISVGGFLIIFVAFLVAREIRKRDQEKTERLYSQ